MNNVFKRILCCMLSLILVFGSGISAFAEDETTATPVIVINDISANPIRNTDDGSVVFNFSDYQVDILFTSGFSSEITELFSSEVIEQITSGDMEVLDIVTLLIDYFGFSGDINSIVNQLLELVTSIMGNMNTEEIDIEAIIANIDFEQYIQNMKDELTVTLQNMVLLAMNDDGTPVHSNIGAVLYPESLEYYYNDDFDAAYALAGDIGESIAEEIGYENTFVFTYDWRLDPIANAQSLSEYIENVKTATGAEKVSIVSEGYGSTVATTYLAENETTAADTIHNFVTISSEYLGTSLVGDFFKGEIINEFSSITKFTSAYIRYTNDISDNPITAFTTWLINYILNREHEAQALCNEIQKILAASEYFSNTIGLTEEMAKMPGMWALVPVNDYDAAVENLFDENTNADLIAKIDAFKNYQYDYEYILQNAKDEGINISVVAAWDLQILPIGENNSVQSDGIVDTAYASFGATCIDLNDVGTATKAVQMYNDGHKHISTTYDMLTPWHAYAGICKYIDASTCALPENTWFIKNMKHGTFSWESNSVDFIIWLVTADEERTVWQDIAYKQFMNYNRFINPGILNSNGVVANPSEPGGYLLGDINLDGLITSLDAQLALQISAGDMHIEEDSIVYLNGDVYADGNINEADARKILLISAGLIDNMQSGIKFNYESEQGSLINSSYNIELRPAYNPAMNHLELSVVLLNAKDSVNGNFIVKFDPEMFTYSDVDIVDIDDGYIVAGAPDGIDGTISCAYSVTDAVSNANCDDNGDLVLAKFYLDVSRNIALTSISAGAAYFYENSENVYITPVSIDLDEDFFFMLGDATNERCISAQDARAIIRIAAELEEVADDDMFKRCDVDLNNEITAMDARAVLRVSARLQDHF